MKPLTPAAYAVAQQDYARYCAGDELEFEQEMDGSLPEKLLLCQLDQAFQAFRQELDAIGATLPMHDASHDGLALLLTAATVAADAGHQAFLRRFVQHDTP